MQALLRSLIATADVLFVTLAREIRIEELSDELSDPDPDKRKANQVVFEVIDRFEDFRDSCEEDIEVRIGYCDITR